MEGTLLESRLNSILEKEGFGVKSKTNKNSNNNNNNSSYSTANGIFVSHYYIVLELENEETPKISSKEKQQQQQLIQPKSQTDDDSITVSVWLWIIDMSAVGLNEQLCYKVPLILQPHNAISLNDPLNSLSSSLSSSSSSAGAPSNTLTLSPKQGENSLNIISSAVDPFQVAVYSPKQIFSGHIAEFLAKLKTLQPKQPIPALKLLRVEILVGKYSPSIISIKFHKLSSRHLAILTDDGFFTVFNVSDSVAFHEIQWNMANIPRYGSQNEFYLEETDQQVHFVDFEFGGSARFAVQNSLSPASTSTNATINGGQFNQINDFDFLAVYFLTDSGKLYYQSPLILRDIRIDRDLLEQLGQYLLSEIDLVQKYEKIPYKLQALKEYLRIVTMLEKGDLLNDSEQSLQFTQKSNLDNHRKIPIFNTVNSESIKVQLQYIEVETGTQDQQSQQSSRLTRESELSRKWKQSLKENTTNSSIKKRAYSQLSKVETFGGCLHVFVLTKAANINSKNYATVQILFSPLPAMPTHLIQEHYTLRLLKAEKARLQLQIQPSKAAILGQNASLNTKTSQGVIHPRLISNSITQRSLDCVCFVLFNKVFSINFAWTQQLLDSYLEDPNILLPSQYQDNEGKQQGDNNYQNDNNSSSSSRQQSSARVIVDLIPSQKDNYIQFYAASQQDKTIVVIVPPSSATSQQQSQSFKLRCFSLDYLTNYIQIQASAKILSSKISQLIAAAIPSAEIPKEMLKTTNTKQSLEVNKKNISELKQGSVVSLKAFETEASEFMKEHEKIVKHNIQLICERHAEVTKAKELLEKKKNEVETNILSVVARQREQLEETRKKIIKNNVNIQDKLCGIAGMLRQLNPSNNDYVLSQQYNHEACNHAIQEVKEYPEGGIIKGSEVLDNRVHNLYDRLQQLKVQYQTYFSKRQTFLESVGQTALPENLQELAVDQNLLDSAKSASNILRKHAEALDEQNQQEK